MGNSLEIPLIPLTLQKLLYLMYINNRKLMFHTQKLLITRQPFNEAMKKLVKWNAVKKKDTFVNGRVTPIYSMTTEGIIFVEEYMNDYARCQKKKD